MKDPLINLYKELKDVARERSYSNTLFKIGNVKERARFKGSIEILRAYYDDLEKVIKAKIAAAKNCNVAVAIPAQELELVTDFKTPFRLAKVDDRPRIISPERPAKQTAELRNWQQNTANLVFDSIVGNIVDSRNERYNACLIEASTGSGKTYMVGNVIARLVELDYFKDWPAAYHTMVITKANVVEQFKRDLQYQFGVSMEDGVLVTNYEQLRSSFGDNVLRRDIKIVYGNEIEIFKWHPFLHPKLIIWDECHSLKNEDSTQSKIGQALNDLKEGSVFQVLMSATPFTRIADCKCFTCACGAPMY